MTCLYDTLLGINDKQVGRFIEYIMTNGGIEKSQKIFDGICLAQTQDGRIAVTEGNYRILT